MPAVGQATEVSFPATPPNDTLAGGKGKTSVELLSDRELEVYRLIGEGMGTRQIAVTLQLTALVER